MPDLASLLNAPSEFAHGDKTYQLRQPTLMECAEYQRWLESEARASAAAATELTEEDRRQLLRDTNTAIASKTFCWGGEACVSSLRTPDGIAKLFSIVCREQGLTYRTAREAVDRRLTEIAAILLAAQAGDDPEKKAQLGRLLATAGLPADYLSTSSSASASPPTGQSATSPLSPG